MNTWKFTTIISLLSTMCIAIAIAGEPIIFDNSSKLILPKEDLDPYKLGKNGEFGGRTCVSGRESFASNLTAQRWNLSDPATTTHGG
ncbi:hypothetical protein N8616_02910 [Verrucomicrobia bacterium]|nr:hypothetical protein [Verrucomicrobiota bacterium]